MLIDLHCHTRATKGEGSGRNVTRELFARKIEAAQVGIVAITNHNDFDLKQFDELSESVKGIAQVWPGVELDVDRWTGGKPWHMIVVMSPERKTDFKELIDGLKDGVSPKKCHWPFEMIWETFKDYETLFISHCHDKNPAITDDEIERINAVTNSSWRFYYEPRKLTTLGIWSNHGYSMMMGSDVKDWDCYEQSRFVSLRLNVDSFEQFYLLAQRDRHVVETLLNRKSPVVLTAKPHKSVEVDLPLYQDVNVLFGQKGTGKSEMVNSIQAKLDADGAKTALYRGGKKNALFEDLIKVKNEERSCSAFNRSDCRNEIEEILDWSEELPTPINQYIQWRETFGNNEKKDRFTLSEGQKLSPIGDGDFKDARKDFSGVKSFFDFYLERNIGKYLEEKDANDLQSLLRELTRLVLTAVRGRYVEKESVDLANRALGQIKASIDKKSETRSKPSDAGFLRFAYSRMRLLSSVITIENSLRPGTKVTRAYLGRLEDKGSLDIALEQQWLSRGMKSEEFKYGIRILNKWKETLLKIRGAICSEGLSLVVKEFGAVHEESGITDLSAFIGLKKYVVKSDTGKRYDPSDGEKGILMIERVLDEEADFYLLDEPELGMGNQYIDSVIRPKVMDLAAMRKTVVIATHNANLAVRTLPYLSVYRCHVGGDEYKTYIGNPFLNKLTNIVDDEDKISWSETSMRTLEGGREAFYDRRRIYEAGNEKNDDDCYD